MNLFRRNRQRSNLLAPASFAAPHRFRIDMNNLFNRLAGVDPWTDFDLYADTTAAWMPAVDITRTNDLITVRADLPGIEPKDIDVRIRDNVLTIAGERFDEIEGQGNDKDSWFCERSFGSFNRAIELPASVDASKVNAEYANGVLTVKMPLPAAIVARQIDVKPAAATNKTPVRPSIAASSNATQQRVSVGAGA